MTYHVDRESVDLVKQRHVSELTLPFLNVLFPISLSLFSEGRHSVFLLDFIDKVIV
jgi:hypothetical protein